MKSYSDMTYALVDSNVLKSEQRLIQISSAWTRSMYER